jgi:hypothetical protein
MATGSTLVISVPEPGKKKRVSLLGPHLNFLALEA